MDPKSRAIEAQDNAGDNVLPLRRTYLRNTGGKLWGRPEAGIDEVERRALLPQIRGREVDGDAIRRERYPALRMAVRTRSRLSRTAESGSPTVVSDGSI